jgi:polyferredoxin
MQGQVGLVDTYGSGLRTRGLAAWSAALGLTAFYLVLYFTEAFTPVAAALGLPSKWTLYGGIYTLVMILGGWSYLSRHGSSRYHRARVATNVGVQAVLAFSLPFAMSKLGQHELYFSYLWPLKIEYLYPATLSELPPYFVVYSLLASFVAVPALTLTFGKRWYCSWICGCGALTNTFGDPWRHLSSKSERAWAFERISIHAVLVLAVLTTGIVAARFFWGADYPAFAAFADRLQSVYAFFVGAILSGIVGVAVYPILGPRVWCRYFCPMAALLGLLQKLGRFRIAVKPDLCIACGNCSTYCEMGIDVRAYAMQNQSFTRASCVGCGMCSHVCPRGVLRLDHGGARSARLRILP